MSRVSFFAFRHVVPLNAATISSGGNVDSSSNKTNQRRKKGPGHRRTNSKGSTASWTPPTLFEIARQEDKRASLNVHSNIIENPINDLQAPIPSISAGIDSKATPSHHRQLNPSLLKLDLDSSPTKERPTTLFTYVTRKSSSSDPEEHGTEQHFNASRQRRRRPFSGTSSTRMNSLDQTTPQADEKATIVDPAEPEKRVSRNVNFLLTPQIGTERSPSFTTRKTFTRVSSSVDTLR